MSSRAVLDALQPAERMCTTQLSVAGVSYVWVMPAAGQQLFTRIPVCMRGHSCRATASCDLLMGHVRAVCIFT
jgi:hypothetical protein